MVLPSALSSSLSFSLVFLVASAVLISDNAEAARLVSRNNQRRSVGTNMRVAFLCTRTDYPAVCMATLKKSPTADPRAAATTSIQQSIVTAMKARAYAATLIESRGQRGAAKAGLRACKSHYSDAVSDLQTSLRYLKRRDKGSLMINLSAALADVAACNDEFKNPRASPLAKYGATLNKLTSNNLALASLVR